jgi:cholesterol transport system auxiliary component
MKLNRDLKNFIFIFIFLLSGCSLLSPVTASKNSTYMLNAYPRVLSKKQHHSSSTLLVTMPEARPAYNTRQMAYTLKPYQIAYFAYHQWAETPSQMLEPLLVESLQNTQHFHAVVTPPYAGHYDYVLNTQILTLQQDFTHYPALLHFAIRLQLMRTTTNQVIAIKEFAVRLPISKKTPYSGVIAANAASAILLKKIAKFCVQHTRV